MWGLGGPLDGTEDWGLEEQWPWARFSAGLEAIPKEVPFRRQLSFWPNSNYCSGIMRHMQEELSAPAMHSFLSPQPRPLWHLL